jgi:AraC-like DNA-binding protein
MDLLGDVLALSGVHGAVGAAIEAGGDWGWWWTAPVPRACLHAVTSGTAWLALAGQPPVQLMPGDVVLLPGGPDHALGSDPEAVARTSEDVYDPWHHTGSGAVRIGTGPVQAHVLCADYDHDATVSTQVLDLLPDLVHLRAGRDAGLLDDTVRLLGRELARPQLATGVVLDRLVDVLLVQFLRTWLATRPEPAEPSWLGALGDPVIGAAVARLHDDPARAWTTDTLAREVSVSRSTLTRRFSGVIGESPGAYLTRWRMDLAARRLRDTDDRLEAVAASVGYDSVYAFSRAFRRARSLPPGRYRAEARHALSARNR